MTKKEKSRQILKEKFFKLLHVICYVLSAIFILVLVLSGVKGCNNKKQNSVIKSQPQQLLNFNNYPLVYQYKFGAEFTITIADQQNLCNGQLDLLQEYTTEQPYYEYSIIVNGALIFDDSSYIACDTLFYRFSTFQFNGDNTRWRYRLDYVSAYDSVNESYYRLVNKKQNYFEYIYYQSDFTGHNPRLILNNNDLDNPNFLYFFESLETSQFIFNYQFNYNAPMGLNLNGVYGYGASFTYVASDTAYIDVNTGYFISNNQIFNKIRLYYMKTGAVHVTDGDKIFMAPADNYIYFMMYYMNTDNNTMKSVNVRDSSPYEYNGGWTRYFQNSTTWTVDQYRYITFLSPLSTDDLNFINSLNNNNQSYFGGSVYGSGGDIFSLLSYAFTSLLPFLSIAILPGISIGVLLFLPAVVGIIIILFHILKK